MIQELKDNSVVCSQSIFEALIRAFSLIRRFMEPYFAQRGISISQTLSSHAMQVENLMQSLNIEEQLQLSHLLERLDNGIENLILQTKENNNEFQD